MFTGIIRYIGILDEKVRVGRGSRLTIQCPEIVPRIETGSSVCTNGICLTVTQLSENGFSADLSEETLRRSTLGGLRNGERLNLEPSLRLGDEIGGHLVFGHVDAVGQVQKWNRVGEGWECIIRYPATLAPLIAEKGSIAIDGVSLTVARLESGTFAVAVIPYTYEHTTLSDRREGDPVNMEADMLARYVARRLAFEEKQSGKLTKELLQEHGFGN